MCGRYTAPFDGKELAERYRLNKYLTNLIPTYNAAPGMRLPVITKNSPLKSVLMKWGFVPVWEKDFTQAKFKPINARSDKLDGGFFRQAFNSNRCLVPCAGYYEWKKLTHEGKVLKTPYYFTVRNELIFSLGGVYSVHRDAEGVEYYFFTVITTEANELQETIHNRMPLIINRDEEDKWLIADNAMQFVKPFDSKKMNVRKVSPLVSSFKNDGPKLIKKVN